MPLFHHTILVLSFIWVLLFAGSIAQTTTIPTVVVSAQPTTTQSLQPPICAKACIESATEAQACAGTDNQCLCQHTSAIQTAISSCLASSGSCSEADRTTALAFYPQSCALLGYSTFVSTTVGVVSATGAAPSKVSQQSISSLVLTATPGATINDATTTQTTQYGLGLPAILGITLGGVVLITAIAVFFIWLYLRRRQQHQHQRSHAVRRTIDLESEFGGPISRPPRAGSKCSTFIVEQEDTEKEHYNENSKLDYPLSRSSTLVSIPPRAVVRAKALPEIRESFAERESNLAMKQTSDNRASSVWSAVMSGAQSLRTSWMSGRARSEQSSLMVEPLTIRKSGLYCESGKEDFFEEK